MNVTVREIERETKKTGRTVKDWGNSYSSIHRCMIWVFGTLISSFASIKTQRRYREKWPPTPLAKQKNPPKNLPHNTKHTHSVSITYRHIFFCFVAVLLVPPPHPPHSPHPPPNTCRKKLKCWNANVIFLFPSYGMSISSGRDLKFEKAADDTRVGCHTS